ncbi:hypothetical protein ACHAXT_000259 [Thalassiosira profunda]
MADPSKKKAAYAQVPLTLTEPQWAWLDDMASKHKLSSTSKAVRCCINCVALGDVAGDSPSTDEEGITKGVELSSEQLSWLRTRRNEQGDAAERRVVQSCMNADEYTVFGVIRCKLSIRQCSGAKEAVKNIGEEFGQKAEEVTVKENIDIAPKECGCGK